MFALRATRQPPYVLVEPADVVRISGYAEGRRTRVLCTNGKAVHLAVPVEQVRAALDADRDHILTRGLDHLLVDRCG